MKPMRLRDIPLVLFVVCWLSGCVCPTTPHVLPPGTGSLPSHPLNQTQRQTVTGEPQLRLALDLIDGSHIIGSPSIRFVPLQTSYAKVNVPLEQILTISVKADHEAASITMKNADRLQALVDLETIQLATLFGKVTIDIGQIRQIRVMLDGGKPGLILWNKMGSDEEVLHSAVGPNGNIQGAIDVYEPGVFGNAAHLRGSAGEVYFDIPYLENKHLGADPFTIAFWAKSSSPMQPQGFIMDQLNEGTMMIRFSQLNPSTMQSAIPATFPNMHHQWDTQYHHYAVVVHQDGRSALYMDGEVEASSDNTPSLGQAFSSRIVLSGEWDLTDGYDWNGYIDNVKAWNYAKTDFSDRNNE